MPELHFTPYPMLADGPVCTPGPDGRCSICADEGLPGTVLELRADSLALVELPDGPQEVALDLLDDVQVGEQVLVHIGVAIARLGEQA